MPELSKNQMSYKEIYNYFVNAVKSKVIMSGLELKIFDYLQDYKASEEIASELTLNEFNTDILLNALESMGFVEKNENRFKNRKHASTFFVSTSQNYIGGLLSQVNSMSLKPLDNLTQLIKNGPFEKQPDFSSQEIWQDAVRASSSWVGSGFGYTIAKKIAGLEGFNQFKSLLDLGGGHGLFGLYIACENPEMKCIIFDQKKVIPVAEEFIKKYEMEDRVSTIAGDYFKDDFNGSYDIIYASATLNFAKNCMDEMVEKIYNSVNPNGYFISLHGGTAQGEASSNTMLSQLASVVSSGKDFSFERGFIAKSMLKAGFRYVRTETIDTPMGLLDFEVALK